MIYKNDSAVSPIVGVMLMLVVTIIIAAVVSAFAGGLSSETTKTPQMTISADYSQSGGLTLFHAGGDPVTTTEVRIEINPTSATTSSSYLYVYPIETGNITGSSGAKWGTAKTDITGFLAGDSAYVNATNMGCSVLQPQVWTADGENDHYCLDSPQNIGKPIIIKVMDLKSNIIAKTQINVKP
jgi:FlaG/FlaF family flagellin (archaellin)